MKFTLLAIDLAKNSFQLHGIDERGNAVLRQQHNRKKFIEFMGQCPRTIIAMEACGGAHYWGRKFRAQGHEVRLMAAKFVKPFVKSQKNDRNDAEAIAEAASRPSMRFIGIKEIWQQELQSIHRVRTMLIHDKTALSNQIRGFLTEFGIIAPVGFANLNTLVQSALEDGDNDLTGTLRDLIADLWSRVLDIDSRLEKINHQLKTISREREPCKRLCEVPGVGPTIATAMVSAIGDPKTFKNGRDASAWLGLVPRQHSTGGKTVLLGITKRGDRTLRSLVVQGARSLVLSVQIKKEIAPEDRMGNWIKKNLATKGFNKTAIAVANKNVRIMWALLAREESYRPAQMAS
jgi:transposase